MKNFNLVEHPTDRDEHYVEHPMCAESGINWCIIIGTERFKPESGGGRKMKIKLLGCSERKGATVVPKQKPLPQQATIPIPQAQQSPNLIDVIAPGPDFGG